MMKPTHSAFALAGALAVVHVTDPAPAAGAILVAVTMTTAMLPDKMEGSLFEHRGATHRWWMGVLLVALLGVALLWASVPFAVWITAGLAVGFGMHLVADGMTRSGLPGRGGRRVHFLPRWLRPRTGQVSETPFRVAAVIVCMVLAYKLLPAEAQHTIMRELAALRG